jgi:hypothetical protein
MQLTITAACSSCASGTPAARICRAAARGRTRLSMTSCPHICVSGFPR